MKMTKSDAASWCMITTLSSYYKYIFVVYYTKHYLESTKKVSSSRFLTLFFVTFMLYLGGDCITYSHTKNTDEL